MEHAQASADEGEGEPKVFPRWLLLAALIGGNAALAIGPWFVRLSDTGPVSLGFWRLLLPLPFFLLLARRERSESPLDLKRGIWIALAGISFSIDLSAWHLGIERTRLGNSVLLANSGSVLLMIWGLVQLRRAPTGREGAAILAALGGAAILLGRSFEISARTLAGDLMCLTAGFFYMLYLIQAQRVRGTLGQWTVLSLVSLAGAPFLLVVALMLGEPVLPGDAGWGPVVAIAISGQVVGQGLLVYSMRHFPPLVIGLALLTQPALAATVGWLVFGEVLVPFDIFGMLLVGAALVIARAGRAEAAPAKGSPIN